MSPRAIPEMPLVESVLHPSDFSATSEAAFAHALAIALLRQTRLTILHVGPQDYSRVPWTQFPGVRETLERWGLLETGSPRSAVYDELKIRVKKVAVRSRRPMVATLEYLQEHPSDLIVLGTGGREGLPRWLQRSVAEPLARESRTMTLFVPEGARGLITPGDGNLSLRRILVPVDQSPHPQAAIQFATRAARVAGDDGVGITLLHVGEASGMPVVDLPEDPSCTWHTEHRRGDAVEEIINAAQELPADLIAMVTAGHEGILDALRGSTTEQIVRRAPCPVLAVPIAWVDKVAAGDSGS